LWRHGKKSEEEFVAFLRNYCWNPRPELGKLKGDMNKRLKEEAKKCYSLFYNEAGLFRDGELFNENEKKLELKIVVNKLEIVIKAEDRKELMEQYFELAFLPMMQSGEVSLENDLFPIWDDEENDGDIEILDLADKIKLDEEKKRMFLNPLFYLSFLCINQSIDVSKLCIRNSAASTSISWRVLICCIARLSREKVSSFVSNFSGSIASSSCRRWSNVKLMFSVLPVSNWLK